MDNATFKTINGKDYKVPLYNKYFTAREILGYNPLFSLVLSDRSDGKTFNCKVRAIEDYERYHETSIYVRRWDTEITRNMYETFMDEVMNVSTYAEYDAKYEFKCAKTGVQIRAKGSDDEWDQLIYFLPLSKSAKLKSQLDVSNVRTISFDEYVPLDGRYIKNEMTYLLELWKSIDRDRDRTQLILLGNRIDPFCPFLSYFNISMNIENKRLKLYREGTVAVQIYVSEEHREHRSGSRFQVAVKGTSYEGYEQGGVLFAKKPRIGPVPKEAKPMYSFIVNGVEGTIWYKISSPGMWLSSNKRRDLPVLLVNMDERDPDDSRTYYSATFVSASLRNAYHTDTIGYTNPQLVECMVALARVR